MAALALALLLAAAPARAAPPPPAADGQPVYGSLDVHGRVILDRFTRKLGVPAVTFDHWRHRALFTCRVCHVDVGFALKAGESQVSAESNEAGQHCGACHDGKMLHEGKPVFAACNGWPRPDKARGCLRCHTGPNPGPGQGYEEFRKMMPLDAAGDIDWEAGLRRGFVRPSDSVDKVSIRRAPLKIDRDVEIRPKGGWMNDIVFSHKKHVTWIGCELCHPEIFPVTKRGAVKYDMSDIRAGRFCGVCHLNVAFPISSCDRCHLPPSRRGF